MAVRWRRYFPVCQGKRADGDKHGKVLTKGIDCNGKRSALCPENVPSPCGAWAIDFRHPDGRWISKIYPEIETKTAAEHYFSIIRADILRGKFNLPSERAIPTLATYGTQYLEQCKNLKENTFISKRRAVNILIEYIGNYRLDKLNDVVVARFVMQRQDAGTKPGTINEDIAKFKHILSTACRAGIITKNPCSIRKMKVLQTRDRVLSSEEIAFILNGAGLELKDRLMILISIFSGMRLNEIVSLKWSELDFARHLISFTATKTSKNVTVPMSSYLANELLLYKSNATGAFVFENKPVTGRVVNAYSLHFRSLFKRLNFLNCSFHSLRHTFLSLHGNLGTGAFITKELAGHSSLNMTLRYTHVNMDGMRKAIETYTGHILASQNKDTSLTAQTG